MFIITHLARFALFLTVLVCIVTGTFVVGSQLMRNHAPMLAFVSERDGNEEIYLMDVAYGKLYNLTQHYNDNEYPAWSPDGGRLAFQSVREGSTNIFVFDLHAGELTAITDTQETSTIPAWSPDGSMIAVSASNAEAERELHVIDTIDGRRVRLTPENEWGTAPDWSPDDQRIVYSNDGLWIIDQTGENIRQLTTGMDGAPTWSPDGRQIAYIAGNEGNWDIFTFDLATGKTSRITHNHAADLDPHWQP
jgi:Tol biopolymer transport system component